jgi:Ca2+:H+ antiporter
MSIYLSTSMSPEWSLAATQVQASLLSVSVSVLLLPAAYHFALSGRGGLITEEQKRDILRMSHGVRTFSDMIVNLKMTAV